MWLTDITEHRTGEGKVYLCAIKDVSTHASAEALQMVLDVGVIEGASSAITQIDDLVAG